MQSRASSENIASWDATDSLCGERNERIYVNRRFLCRIDEIIQQNMEASGVLTVSSGLDLTHKILIHFFYNNPVFGFSSIQCIEPRAFYDMNELFNCKFVYYIVLK